ncbi:MAG: integrase [Pseudomonadales bacterium RIFCSPLOWO2_12_60_38]|uniref:DNA-binding protein n=1 Tax=Pseudomonas TaxID=286 RepID=UPI0003DD0965|nr:MULTISPECIES: DNA-binding protein [unclassified Pseudomonas]ETK41849.1 integrase [Pseudomonas fluorescens FH5]OHC33533.1 MAG: integrase [Pseudomonadales bacterium RIFCSPLOWO2_12_60_38]OHC40563.1 MAG: integrase [Pseudomonadales bacterium RIFCSPLOWO2_12_FULL_59_450]PTT11552.1 integrase [Pseudomonas sp. HMWF034]PVV70661.1 integrase [Pseudomonas sp. HMWF011]
MARGGINKAVVQKARQALLARGLYPSIDAVRVELGNTGSKTTISRYLKEIESFDPRPPSSRERMGEEISTMVQSLLDRLMQEGNESIEQARSAFDMQRVGLEAQIFRVQSELTTARRQLDTQQAAIEAQTADLQTALSSLQAELTRNAGITQRCTDLEALVGDRDKQIQSLEEKHAHARGALEHYRESVKEQRDQDQRRHESQLHESQVEQRKLQETLVLKQDDLTRLNRENERLLSESRQQVKTLYAHEARIQALTGEIQGLKLAEAKSAGISEQLQEQIATLRQDAKALSEAATQSSEREQEVRLLLAAAQLEAENLRRLHERDLEEHDPNPPTPQPKSKPSRK